MIKNATHSIILFLIFCIAQNGFAQELTKVSEYMSRTNQLNSEEIGDLEISQRLLNEKLGVAHLYVNAVHQDLRLINSMANATISIQTGEVLAVSHNFQKLKAKNWPTSQPGYGVHDAINIALKDANMTASTSDMPIDNRHRLVEITDINYHHTTNAELAYYLNSENEILLVWNFDLIWKDKSHWYSYYINAQTGEIVDKIDWQLSCNHASTGHSNHSKLCEMSEELLTPLDGSGYRVLPFPVESPNHGNRELVNQPGLAMASPFGWHDTNGSDGPEFTTTRGNNVHAYEDINDNDSPGFSPNGGPNLLFDFPYDQSTGPSTYTSASITNLFYTNNRIHDLLAVYGFDEASGNFQMNNYSGQGEGDDYVMAESQDGGGENNANMATPPEGSNPRMQMYLWMGPTADLFTINSPSSFAGSYPSSDIAAFGPSLPPGGITAEAVFLNDGEGSDNYDACSAAMNAGELSGKIALVFRGSCNFTDKVINAQNAGAIACVIINNQAGIIPLGGTDNNVNIPSLLISLDLGQSIFTENVQNGTIFNITLNDANQSNTLDGCFDNGIVTHEYVHGLTNRLTGGAFNSNCLGNDEQMGEGWSDWYATMFTMDLSISNPTYRPMGTFATGVGTQGNGIRPAPYDTSFAVNAYTYQNISNSNISIPHGVGFIWATMLWDFTWAMINQYGYDPNLDNGVAGNNMALQIVTEALKLQVCEPGFADGRDAILLADELLYGGANNCLIWRVFAKRGLGYSASQGSSQSVTDGTAAFDLPPMCQSILLPPVALFSVNDITSCSGTFLFTDLSDNIPQAWLWDFGDGNTSDVQNPSHSYAEPGIYQVSLTVTNSLGEDTYTSIESISYEPISLPEIDQLEIVGCSGDVFLLSTINVVDNVKWYSAAGELITEGQTFEYTVGNTDEIISAIAENNAFISTNVGPVNGSIGIGNNHATDFIGTVDFEAIQPLRIERTWVISGAIGERTINLWDGPSASGTIVDQRLVNINFIGGGWIDLNFEIEIPGQYSIGLNQANLFRNNGGVNYPYTVPGLISINGSSAGPDLYYYFYNIQVDALECQSEAVNIQINSLGNANFTLSTEELTATFTPETTNADTYLWDFGDGNSSDEIMPVHTYAESGIYTISLTVNGLCSFETQVEIIIQSMGEMDDDGWKLYPNPANDILVISRDKIDNTIYQIGIYDLNGRLIHTTPLSNSAIKEINISDLSNGIYTIELSSEMGVVSLRKKLIVAH